MINIEKNLKIKVLVLGDSGVGKSSFAHLLCYNQSSKNPGYTIGCSVEIKLHDFKQGTADEKTFCIEMWDIGASKSHASSRFIFYNNVNGIILVHDLTNSKSLQNLTKWLNDVLSYETTAGLSSVKIGSANSHIPDENASHSIPLLVVGTKLDLVHESRRSDILTRTKHFAHSVGCGDIHLDNLEPKYVAAGSGNAVELSRFFDEVIEHTLTKRTTTSSTMMQSPVVDRKGSVNERRRPNIPQVNRLLGFKSD